MSDALFSDDGLRIVPEAREEMTVGERLRIRQAARIRAGMHPLSIGGSLIRLHPDAPREAHKDDGGTYPRCGSCLYRRLIDHHNRTWSKCTFGTTLTSVWPRATHSAATDVRAWWPACADYAPPEAS